ncbi:MAG: hypothetical protein DRK00_02855 [Thermoprotei archaeon]|nr:MAG: hypothetical protein DRK00_02855 [Thermoprotei archaeon]
MLIRSRLLFSRDEGLKTRAAIVCGYLDYTYSSLHESALRGTFSELATYHPLEFKWLTALHVNSFS